MTLAAPRRPPPRCPPGRRPARPTPARPLRAGGPTDFRRAPEVLAASRPRGASGAVRAVHRAGAEEAPAGSRGGND
ncbi:hypothetical protein CRM73_14055 [Kocuria sp. CCUG 69068]|nr:hypothetical protein [Kocuria sp. CCUG 69068]